VQDPDVLGQQIQGNALKKDYFCNPFSFRNRAANTSNVIFLRKDKTISKDGRDYSLILIANESLTKSPSALLSMLRARRTRPVEAWAYWSAAKPIWRLETKWRMRSVNLYA